MASNLSSDYNIDTILTRIANHATKHLEEFRNPVLGKTLPIFHTEDLRHHLLKTLFDKETKSFAGKDNRDFFYNQTTNTLVVINAAKDKNGNIWGGTVYRPDEAIKDFHYLYEQESRALNFKPILHEKNGIVALKPEMAKQFAQDYFKKQGQNLTTFKKAEITPQRQEANHPRPEKSLNAVKPSPDLIKQQSHKQAR